MALHPPGPVVPNLIGRAPQFVHVLNLVQRMARFDAPVLIQGETGTGKELAARAIHYLSARRDAPFVALNCGAVPETLIESELFGCERGAYTDAHRARAGLVSAANGGTLFLDEVDALPLRAQVSLLRFLQEQVYRPVGGTRELQSEVRIVAAASQRLQGLLHSGAFRDDLAYRLNVLALDMPPLRERPGDPLLLAEHFIEREARHYGLPVRPLDEDSCNWLERYSWPGNVRELHNLVQRGLCLSEGTRLRLVPVARAGAPCGAPASGGPGPADPTLPFDEARAHVLLRFEQNYLMQLMAMAKGNVTHAARVAHKERRTLGRMLKRHSIDRSSFGDERDCEA